MWPFSLGLGRVHLLILTALNGFQTSSANNGSCGYAYIGYFKCGVVHQPTSVDIILWPPAETTYEVTMVFSNEYGYFSGTNYFTNINETTTVTAGMMFFQEPDTRNLSIIVRGFNDDYWQSDDYDDDYLQKYYNTVSSSEACYETAKPARGDAVVWELQVTADSCKEVWLDATTTGSSHYRGSLSFFFGFRSGCLVLISLCVIYMYIRKMKESDLQIALAADSLLHKSGTTASNTEKTEQCGHAVI